MGFWRRKRSLPWHVWLIMVMLAKVRWSGGLPFSIFPGSVLGILPLFHSSSVCFLHIPSIVFLFLHMPKWERKVMPYTPCHALCLSSPSFASLSLSLPLFWRRHLALWAFGTFWRHGDSGGHLTQWVRQTDGGGTVQEVGGQFMCMPGQLAGMRAACHFLPDALPSSPWPLPYAINSLLSLACLASLPSLLCLPTYLLPPYPP